MLEELCGWLNKVGLGHPSTSTQVICVAVAPLAHGWSFSEHEAHSRVRSLKDILGHLRIHTAKGEVQ